MLYKISAYMGVVCLLNPCLASDKVYPDLDVFHKEHAYFTPVIPSSVLQKAYEKQYSIFCTQEIKLCELVGGQTEEEVSICWSARPQDPKTYLFKIEKIAPQTDDLKKTKETTTGFFSYIRSFFG